MTWRSFCEWCEESCTSPLTPFWHPRIYLSPFNHKIPFNIMRLWLVFIHLVDQPTGETDQKQTFSWPRHQFLIHIPILLENGFIPPYSNNFIWSSLLFRASDLFSARCWLRLPRSSLISAKCTESIPVPSEARPPSAIWTNSSDNTQRSRSSMPATAESRQRNLGCT